MQYDAETPSSLLTKAASEFAVMALLALREERPELYAVVAGQQGGKLAGLQVVVSLGDDGAHSVSLLYSTDQGVQRIVSQTVKARAPERETVN